MSRVNYRKQLWDKLRALGEIAIPNKRVGGLCCAVWLPKRRLAVFDRELSSAASSALHDARVNFRVRPTIAGLKYSILTRSNQ